MLAQLMISTMCLTLPGQFVEPEAMALRVLEGATNGDIYGWVAANLPDIDGDGVQEVIIPAIAFGGEVTVYSGATGAVLNRVFGPGPVLGYSVAAAGDVDADGVADYIIGGGRVEVYSGATHALLLSLGATTGFGHSVSGAGDLNGDGRGDLLVGSQSTTTTTVATGRLFALSGLDGTVLWTRDGSAANAFLGSGVGTLDDVTGDGVPDVVVSAYGAAVAYILSGTDGSIVRTLRPEGDPADALTFGRFFASGAGDVDGDGYDDAFIGDYAATARGAPFTGRAYVFSGRTGRALHVLDGVDPGEGFGPGRGIPDVNGDGHADILVAAYTNSDGAPNAGKTYLYSGRSGALLRTITAVLANDNFGVDALSVGDVDGDGRDDFLVTAVGLAFGGLDHGRAYVVAGTPLPCPADLTGNGRVNGADLVRLLRAKRAGTNGGDLDGDDDTDFRDFRVLLADWGRCPSAP